MTMMKFHRHISGAWLCLCLGACSGDKPMHQSSYQRASLITEPLSFNAAGEAREIPSLFEKFTVEANQKSLLIEFPFEGVLVVQLRAGELATTINQERVQRSLGKFGSYRLALRCTFTRTMIPSFSRPI